MAKGKWQITIHYFGETTKQAPSTTIIVNGACFMFSDAYVISTRIMHYALSIISFPA